MKKRRLWRYYSGTKSRAFWARVNALQPHATMIRVYEAGCALQEQESHVLNLLKHAEERQEGSR